MRELKFTWVVWGQWCNRKCDERWVTPWWVLRFQGRWRRSQSSSSRIGSTCWSPSQAVSGRPQRCTLKRYWSIQYYGTCASLPSHCSCTPMKMIKPRMVKHSLMTQEPAIPAFSIPIPILRLFLPLVDFDTDTDTRKRENFDSNSDTDTKVRQVLLHRFW